MLRCEREPSLEASVRMERGPGLLRGSSRRHGRQTAGREAAEIVLFPGRLLPETRGHADAGRDRAWPMARGVEVADSRLGDRMLLLAQGENLRAIVAADHIAT